MHARLCPSIVLAVMLAVPAIQLTRRNLRYYHPANPTVQTETLYERMVGQGRQPTRLTRFIRTNDIAGRVLHEWRWEGYLHWRCPQLKLLLGGRAQQIYDEDDYNTGMSLRFGRDQRVTVETNDPYYTRRNLAALDVHLVAAPTDPGWRPILRRLLHEDPRSGWTYLYRDGRDALLADTKDPVKRRNVVKSLRGELEYPSRSIEAFTQASTMATPAGKALAKTLARRKEIPAPTTDRIFRLLVESVRLDPTEEAGNEARQLLEPLLEEIQRQNAASGLPAGQRPGDRRLASYIKLLRSAVADLREMPIDTWGGTQVMSGRVYLNQLLAEFANQAGQRDVLRKATERLRWLIQKNKQIRRRWQ